MTVIEKAKELGAALAESDVVVRLNMAKEAYENDTHLRAAMQEYNALRAAIGKEFCKEPAEQDKDVIDAMKHRTDVLAEQISANEVYRAFMKAQEELKHLMNEVNSEISFYAFGERPCTHDCASCSSACADRK